MSKFISEISSRDDHLKAMGLITVNFSLLENTIAFIIWLLLGLDQQTGQIITSELSFRRLLELFSSLCRNKKNDKVTLEKLKTLLKRIEHAEQERNKIIHSMWTAGNDEETITRFKITAKIRNGLMHQYEQLKVEHLNKIADEIAEVAAAVHDFWFFNIFQHQKAPSKIAVRDT